MTLEEYQRTPETVLPQELIYGNIRVADAPFVGHQRVVFQLARALDDLVRAEALGEVLVAPVDVVLDAPRALVLQPDIAFVSRERRQIILDRIHGAPDLAVEILSPRPRIGSLHERLHWFAEYGVREVWLYHQPEKRLDIAACELGRVVRVASFAARESPRSEVLPLFRRPMASVLDAYLT